MTNANDAYVHPLAEVLTSHIGSGTKIWQFVVVLPAAVIGADCNICSHCFIENDVVIGDQVTIKNGVQLWDGIRVGDDVFIGPNVTFTNDKFPRSRQHQQSPLTTHTETELAPATSIIMALYVRSRRTGDRLPSTPRSISTSSR